MRGDWGNAAMGAPLALAAGRFARVGHLDRLPVAALTGSPG